MNRVRTVNPSDKSILILCFIYSYVFRVASFLQAFQPKFLMYIFLAVRLTYPPVLSSIMSQRTAHISGFSLCSLFRPPVTCFLGQNIPFSTLFCVPKPRALKCSSHFVRLCYRQHTHCSFVLLLMKSQLQAERTICVTYIQLGRCPLIDEY